MIYKLCNFLTDKVSYPVFYFNLNYFLWMVINSNAYITNTCPYDRNSKHPQKHEYRILLLDPNLQLFHHNIRSLL